MINQYPRSAALLAGLLSATGFAPLNLWPVTLACLAVLAVLIETAPDRRAAFVRGWLFGLGNFTLGLNWIAHAFSFQDSMPHWFGYGAVILLSLYLAVYPAAATLFAWWAARRIGGGLPLLLAAGWIVGEYLRATLFTGFAWNPMGVVWLDAGLAFAAQWIGTYGLSGLAMLTGCAILAALRRRFVWPAALVLFLLLSSALSLHAQLTEGPASGAAIRIVQPNIGQDVKYSPASEAANFRKLAMLSGQATPHPRLIFWPEAAVPAYLDMEPEWRARLASLLGPNDLLMTGGDKVYYRTETIRLPDGTPYQDRVLAGANNSLWVINASADILHRYSKAHLVPYGEYLPLRHFLQPLGLSRLVPGDADFWPGPGPQSLSLPAAPGRPALSMGVQICYEIIFSGQVVDRANRPDFLFNPSNDAWFGNWGPPQHLAQARLRAVEEGLPILRATPTGISAVVDANGHIVDSLPLHREGAIAARLPAPHPPTFFSRTGNWTPLIIAMLLAAAAAFLPGIATRRSRR